MALLGLPLADQRQQGPIGLPGLESQPPLAQTYGSQGIPGLAGQLFNPLPALRYLWGLTQSARQGWQRADPLGLIGLGQITMPGGISADIEAGLRRTLRSIPSELRQGLQRGPDIRFFEGSPQHGSHPLSSGGSYTRSATGGDPSVTIYPPAIPAMAEQYVPTLRHEFVGHALPEAPGLHPATRNFLQRIADSLFAGNPTIQQYTAEEILRRRGQPIGSLAQDVVAMQIARNPSSVPQFQRTEGLAFPSEGSVRAPLYAGVAVSPDEVFAATDALRRAAGLERAARRNPAWAMSLGPRVAAGPFGAAP